jgi:hypothetical protein
MFSVRTEDMEDSQPEAAKDEYFERYLAKYRLTREEGLKSRWRFLTRRPTTTKIFQLLMQHGEMYQAQIARAIERADYRVHHAIGPLLRCEIIETEKRGNRIYFRLRPSAVTQYLQLRDSHQLDEPEQ